jgi:hypothetical protein
LGRWGREDPPVCVVQLVLRDLLVHRGNLEILDRPVHRAVWGSAGYLDSVGRREKEVGTGSLAQQDLQGHPAVEVFLVCQGFQVLRDTEDSPV